MVVVVIVVVVVVDLIEINDSISVEILHYCGNRTKEIRKTI